MTDEIKVIEASDGSREWFRNGKRHRDDGPAVEYANGSRHWYRNGKLHRDDGPAIEYADGSCKWFRNGELHREDGPAVEYANGSCEWFLNDERHREDGPAVEYADGGREWYWSDLADGRGHQFGFRRGADGTTHYVAGCHKWPSLEAALAHYGAKYRGDGNRDECISLLHEVAVRIAKQEEMK